MSSYRNLLITYSILLIFILSGCARYNPKPLSNPSGKVYEKNNIEACKEVLSEEKFRDYFDRRIWARGYVPIQLCVKNNSNKILLLDSYNISLPIEPVNAVCRKMHRDVARKATKYFLIGGPTWAAIEGINSYSVNKKIDSDFKERSVNDNEVIKIKPYGVLNRVMFVAKDNITSNFNIKLVTPDGKEEVNLTV